MITRRLHPRITSEMISRPIKPQETYSSRSYCVYVAAPSAHSYSMPLGAFPPFCTYALDAPLSLSLSLPLPLWGSSENFPLLSGSHVQCKYIGGDGVISFHLPLALKKEPRNITTRHRAREFNSMERAENWANEISKENQPLSFFHSFFLTLHSVWCLTLLEPFTHTHIIKLISFSYSWLIFFVCFFLYLISEVVFFLCFGSFNTLFLKLNFYTFQRIFFLIF